MSLPSSMADFVPCDLCCKRPIKRNFLTENRACLIKKAIERVQSRVQ